MVGRLLSLTFAMSLSQAQASDHLFIVLNYLNMFLYRIIIKVYLFQDSSLYYIIFNWDIYGFVKAYPG